VSVTYNKTPEEWADWLCDEIDKRRFALTGVTYAVQERIGQNIILAPADPKDRGGAGAGTYTIRHDAADGKEPFTAHIIRYNEPQRKGQRKDGPLDEAELLELILDIGHELGHLLLGRGGPGYFPRRPNIIPDTMTGNDDLTRTEEIEADWFALCILQMYGFLAPR